MPPRRYLIATLFIAAMLLILAIVQAPKSAKEGGVGGTEAVALAMLDTFEVVAERPLLDGWSPRFHGAQDPDQHQPWPFQGGFGAPWEPASPYLDHQGLALNGPSGTSEVVLWRSQEWRRYRFDAPLVSARLEPKGGRRLLVTLRLAADRFETRLLEVPEGRVLWASDSGPWSRFSWDGRGVLVGLRSPDHPGILLATLSVDSDLPPSSLATWDEKGLPPPPRGWPTKDLNLWQAGQDLKGCRLLVPWDEETRVWFPSERRIWLTSGTQWILWGLEDGQWTRLDAGSGRLHAQPPLAMGLERTVKDGGGRAASPLDQVEWTNLAPEAPPWPEYDPAWCWVPEGALTAWDLRWGGLEGLPRERQREALVRVFRPDWKVACGLRASVAGWLPGGPEVALRESTGHAWVWIGHRLLLVRLQPSERLRKLRQFKLG